MVAALWIVSWWWHHKRSSISGVLKTAAFVVPAAGAVGGAAKHTKALLYEMPCYVWQIRQKVHSI